jgi:hypothetical protein
MPASAPAAPRTFIQKSWGVFDTWILWRMPALVLWYWLASAIALKALGHDWPCPALLAATPLITGGFQGIMGGRYWYWYLLIYAIYVLIFPWVVVPYLLLTRFPGLFRGAKKVFLVATSPLSALITFCLVVACSIALAQAGDEGVITYLAVIQACLVLFFLLAGVRWASDPLRPLVSVLQWISNAEVAIERFFRERLPNIQAGPNHLPLLDLIERFLVWITDHTSAIAIRAIVPLFLAFLVVTFLGVVSAFSVAIYAVQGLTVQPFNKLGTTWPECWVYSLSVITTAPLSNVIPQHFLGYFLYSTELICTYLLLSVFFSLFAVSMGVHGLERRTQVESLTENILAWIRDIKRRNAAPPSPAPPPADNTNTTQLAAPLPVLPPPATTTITNTTTNGPAPPPVQTVLEPVNMASPEFTFFHLLRPIATRLEEDWDAAHLTQPANLDRGRNILVTAINNVRALRDAPETTRAVILTIAESIEDFRSHEYPASKRGRRQFWSDGTRIVERLKSMALDAG